MRNITDYIKDFDSSLPVGNRQRKVKIAGLINKVLAERKLQPLNVYKLAQSNSPNVNPDSVLRAFSKLAPAISRELISEVWPKESYPTKEEFMSEIQGVENKLKDSANDNSSIDTGYLIRKLDEALLGIRVSPSLVF